MKLQYLHNPDFIQLDERKMTFREMALAALALSTIVVSPFIISKILRRSPQETRQLIDHGKNIQKVENIPIDQIPIPPIYMAQLPSVLPQSSPQLTQQPIQAPVEQPKQDTQEIIYLARILFAEAANQSKEAKEAVAQVILNRVDRSGGKKTIIDVITQKHQFTGYRGKLWNLSENPEELTGPNKKAYAECLDVARRAVDRTLENRIGEATLYHDNTIDTPKSWNKDKIEFITKVGAFTFYKELR